MKYYLLKIKLNAPARLNIGTFVVKCSDYADYAGMLRFLEYHENYTLSEIKNSGETDYTCYGKLLKLI